MCIGIDIYLKMYPHHVLRMVDFTGDGDSESPRKSHRFPNGEDKFQAEEIQGVEGKGLNETGLNGLNVDV